MWVLLIRKLISLLKMKGVLSFIFVSTLSNVILICTMLNISELADHDPSALCNCQKPVLALDNVESKYCTQGHSPFLCNFPENVLVHI